MNARRDITWRGSLAAITVSAVVLLTACDTGDGKQLQPYDPANYPSQTAPPTTDTSDGLDGVGSLDDLAGQLPPSSVGAVPGSAEPFQLFAPWVSGGPIDERNTCDGENVAPAVSWGAVPAGTVEIAIAMVDDSAVSDGEPFVHWVISGLDPLEIALVEGDVPPGAIQALNFFGDVGYGGPCPPDGDEPHLYRLTAYALSQPLGLEDGALANDVLDAIATVTIGSADLSGTYQR